MIPRVGYRYSKIIATTRRLGKVIVTIGNRQMSQYKSPRYFDIAVNLTDRMFHGDYNDKNYHPPDLEAVLERCKTFHVDKILITGSSLLESELAINIAKDPRHTGFLYSTVGVHPCSVGEIDKYEAGGADEYLSKLTKLTEAGKQAGVVKLFGEIGLDYDRLHYASAELQQCFFERQLLIACEMDLPLFLHMRSACDDFISIIKPFIDQSRPDGKFLTKNGVVHSFTGTSEELTKLLELGFYIGVNGCSLKTQENLEVVRRIPLDKLLIETDSPWCEIRKSSASFEMISEYPSIFYPKLSIIDHDEILKPPPATKKNGLSYKFDNFLPIPSIKRDQYNKYIDNLQGKEILPIGINSKPLIKSRNEPVFIGYVAEVVSKLHNVEPELIIESCWQNSCRLFEIDQ